MVVLVAAAATIADRFPVVLKLYEFGRHVGAVGTACCTCVYVVVLVIFIMLQSGSVSEGDGRPTDSARVSEPVHVSRYPEQDPRHVEAISAGGARLGGPAE